MSKYNLQPLRIPSEWLVSFNEFMEYNIKTDDQSDALYCLTEDLLQLHSEIIDDKTSVIIDLGWYPDGDKNGCYKLLFIENENWEKPLHKFNSTSNVEIVETLEHWLRYEFN